MASSHGGGATSHSYITPTHKRACELQTREDWLDRQEKQVLPKLMQLIGQIDALLYSSDQYLIAAREEHFKWLRVSVHCAQPPVF
jgi:hypothetical protein